MTILGVQLWHIAAAGVGGVALLGAVFLFCWAYTTLADRVTGRERD